MEKRNTFIKLALAVFTVTIINFASGENCKNYHHLNFYEELKCGPVKDESGCITSYNCSSIFNQKSNKCYYQGKEYANGDSLAKEDIGSSCIPAACVCISDGENAQFSCPHLDCPENFQPPLRQGCIWTYSHDSCCAQGKFCHDSKVGQKADKCKYNGEEYLEGAVFYPDEAPCKKCICKSGFNGTLESPWCEDIPCDTEIHNSENLRSFCAPIYYGNNSCCPINFFCQEDSANGEHTTSITQKVTESTAKCTFGNETVEVGQKVANPEECTVCACEVPPFVKCVLDPECQNKRRM